MNGLPRFYNGVQIGGVAFTTRLLFASGASGVNTFNAAFYAEDGSMAAPSLVYTLNSGGAVSILGHASASSGTMSVVAGSQASLGLQAELAEQESSRASYAVNSLLFPEYSPSIYIPFAMLDNTTNSVISAQNLASTSQQVFIDLMSEGQIVQTLQRTVNPGAAFVLDLQTVPGLAKPFYGMALLRGSDALVGQLDTFTALATKPLASVAIGGRDLPNVGETVTYTATVLPADAAKPVTYTWQLDAGSPVVNVSPSSQDSRSYTWNAPGLHVINVTAANAISPQVSAQHLINVPSDSGTVRAGQPISLEQSTGDGTLVNFLLLSGGATVGFTLTLTPLNTDQLEDLYNLPQYAVPVGTAFLLQVYSSAQLLAGAAPDTAAPAAQPIPNYTFTKPATLRLRYPAGEVSGFEANGVLALIYSNGQWQDAASTCDDPTPYVRHPADNELSLQICRTGPIVLAVPSEFLFLPLLNHR
jgi:hypothetical protein